MEYKGIVHERLGEAPFIGALILAKDCPYSCEGCFNQYLKNKPNRLNSAREIISIVKENPFNEGLILGGLEWTHQPKDMLDLIEEALNNDLKIMIFTHMTKDEFIDRFPQLINKGIICKFGEYDYKNQSNNYYSNNIKLATTNQYIEYL